MSKHSISIITAAWGDYWERYGEQWTLYIKRLNTTPNEVIIVSDKPINTDFKVIIESDIHLSSFRNAGIAASTSSWVVPSDIDDEPFENYIDNFDDNYDVIAFSLIRENGKITKGEPKKWKNFFDVNTRNGLPSTSAIKRKFLIQTPYRKIGWEDWALWIDLKNAGVNVKFDNTIRGKYNQTANSLSKIDIDKKNQEIVNFKLLKK